MVVGGEGESSINLSMCCTCSLPQWLSRGSAGLLSLQVDCGKSTVWAALALTICFLLGFPAVGGSGYAQDKGNLMEGFLSFFRVGHL